MKPSGVLAFTSILSSSASAHYLFGHFIFENKWTGYWEYIRQISPSATILDESLRLIAPNTDPDSLDLRCGRNATTAWNKPKIATIKAGDTVGFGAGDDFLPQYEKGRMYHPGFATAWLSRSPTDDLNSYPGDGDWFKIMVVTGRTEQSMNFTGDNAKWYNQFKAVWGTFPSDSWNFTIPKSTPPGKYLLRFEHVFPNTYDSQFYVNCAHIKIESSESVVGSPAPLVKIPGIYKRGQPDVYFDHYDMKLIENITAFVPPKPEVWYG